VSANGSDDDFERRLGVRVAQTANKIFTRTYHQMEIFAPSCLPRTGPAILACNHVSGLDPMLIQSACSRMIVWMMAKEYYDLKSLKWFYEAIEAIPVARSGRDMAATRAALRSLHLGRVIGIFPEGRIEPERELLPFQTGIAMMSIKTGVSVYPAYVDGTQRGKEMMPAIAVPNRITLGYGKPLNFKGMGTTKPELEEATERIRQAILELRSRSAVDTILG
jgi:1-acyl-sn-glycerol-3-phosphate acyltransferase